MKKDDLTKVRYIGSARMKLLYESGITTFKQLFETPLGKLAQVKNIGKHYAKQIKDAVAEVYAPPIRKAPEKSKDVNKKKTADVKKKTVKPNQKLQKKIKGVNKSQKQVNLKAKTLGKKNQELCTDIKKRSKKLKQQIEQILCGVRVFFRTLLLLPHDNRACRLFL